MPEPLAIGEFARRSGLTISTLRFYDECGLLRPHSVDPVTGYRSYLADQVQPALLIKNLRALGMPIAEVRRVLASPTSEQRAAVEARVRAEVSRLEQVRATAEQVNRQIDETESLMKMVVRGDALKKAITAAACMASGDSERPLLAGILIEARNGSLRAVATDGYRMSVREMPALAGQAAAFRGAVPACELVEWAGRSEDGADVSLEMADGQLSIHADSRSDFRLIEGTYPDYEVILSIREEWFPAIMRTDELQDAVDQSPENPLHLTFSPSGLDVEGVEGSVNAQYEGPEMTVGLDRGYLRDVLSVATGPDIAVEVTNPTSAVYFRSAEDATSVALLMPLRPAG